MKKQIRNILIVYLICFWQSSEAQNYEFLSGMQGQDASDGIMINKDSIVFWPIENVNNQSSFDIKIYSKNKYLANYNYKYINNKNTFFTFFNSLILNDTTIVLVGSTGIFDIQYGNKCIVILDGCLKPKNVYLLDEKSYGSIIGLMKIDDKTVLLNLAESDSDNISVFVPFDIEKGELIPEKYVTFKTNYGNSILINGEIYYFGANYRDKDPGPQSLKAQLAKFDTSGHLFWEKIYILDEPKQFYDGRDFIQINNNLDFLVFMGDYQSKKSKPTESGGIRVIKIDSSFNIKWHKNITDTNNFEWVYRVAKINNNRYLVIGANYPLKSSNQIECAKLTLIDSNAAVIQTYSFPCRTSGSSRVIFNFRHYAVDFDGNILLAGVYYDEKNSLTNVDAYLVKLKPDLSMASQMLDNRIYYNSCGEPWKDTSYELPEPIMIPFHIDSFARSLAPVYSVGPGTTASIEKTEKGIAKAIIYPNPTHNFLEFYCEDFTRFNEVSFEIYNSVGQLVLNTKQQAISNGKFTINVEVLTAGNYHLKVLGNGNAVNFKLVVE